LVVVTPLLHVAVLILAGAEACKVEVVANKEVDSQKTQDVALSNSVVARVAM
jgi:hypothetical protein